MRQITLKQIGYRMEGTATLKLWGGGIGDIEMTPWEVRGTLTKSKLLNGINDAKFGCESILYAHIRIYELFYGGYVEFLDSIDLAEDRCNGK